MPNGGSRIEAKKEKAEPKAKWWQQANTYIAGSIPAWFNLTVG